jgi:hypothetical protein
MISARSYMFQGYIRVVVTTAQKILANFSSFLPRAKQAIQMELLKGQLHFTPYAVCA